jgi:hypothetical protein
VGQLLFASGCRISVGFGFRLAAVAQQIAVWIWRLPFTFAKWSCRSKLTQSAQDPEPAKRWGTFLRSHREVLVTACNFSCAQTTARNKSDWLRVWNHQQIMPALALEPAMAAATDVPSIFFLKKCLTS